MEFRKEIKYCYKKKETYSLKIVIQDEIDIIKEQEVL